MSQFKQAKFNYEVIEFLSKAAHDAWWDEKKKQGCHAPADCSVMQSEVSTGGTFSKFEKYCYKCHTDMYPYDELPEHVKEYDRMMVKNVLRALCQIAK